MLRWTRPLQLFNLTGRGENYNQAGLGEEFAIITPVVSRIPPFWIDLGLG
jgi:hypothetical protein